MTGFVSELISLFYNIYGAGDAPGIFFAPGRVNLIGEHTDYNGGHVFPCALSMGTYGLIRKRQDKIVKMYSANFKEAGIVEVSLPVLPSLGGWAAYPAGVIWTFEKYGYHIEQGADILFSGDIPLGSGLSSSASIEVLTGVMLRDCYGFDITKTKIAQMAQYSENNYNGMNCGIMDQFACAMGKKDHAIFLDTETLEYEYVPLHLDDARIVIVNSKVKHSLLSSAYNDRRRESEEALADLKSAVNMNSPGDKSEGEFAKPAKPGNINLNSFGEFADLTKHGNINSLGDLSEEEFELYKAAIKDPVCQRRARHAVYENQRTIKAAAALKSNNLEMFGALMNESHVSLRDDYEVSCAETDLLAELAWGFPGVYGARMTGGGFGGCTVNIVKREAVDKFVMTVRDEYHKQTGIRAEFYIADTADGAERLCLEFVNP